MIWDGMSNNFITPNSHPSSFFTGSTVEAMIEKAKNLGTGYYTCTDNGFLTNVLKANTKAKKEGIKLIAGCELYFIDKNCEFTNNTNAEQIKYYTITVHAKTQEAYQYLVRKISENDRNTIKILDQEYPTFNWNDLEDFSKRDFTAVMGGPQCMVCKNILVNEHVAGAKICKKLYEMFGENLYGSIIPIEYNKKWYKSGVFTLTNGQTVELDASLKAETNMTRNFRITLEEVANRPERHGTIKSIYVNGIGYKVNKNIASAITRQSFKEIGTDIYKKYNDFMLVLSKKYFFKLLINDYSYFANKNDKLVQDLKLGDSQRIFPNHSIKSYEDVLPYFEKHYHKDFLNALVENNKQWASNFDNFKLEYNYRLVKEHENHLQATMDLVKKIGRFNPENPEHLSRLKHEIDVIHANGEIDLLPYFFPISKALNFYKDKGRVVGPARGSAGGSFLMYCMGITQTNPLKYGLYFSRFLTLGRILKGSLPDVDCDLPNRELLTAPNGFLETYYKGRWSQISTRTLMKLKSAIRDVNRFKKGKVEDEIEKLAKSLEATPQGIDDKDFVFGYEDNEGNYVPGLLDKDEKLRKYTEERPEEWEIVKRMLGIARQNGRHACFAAGTLVDSNGKVDFIDLAPDFAGNKPITTWYSGVKDTITVSMNNGVSIQCTPDHRFMVGSKEIEAKDLKGEEIYYKSFTNTSGNKNVDSDMAFALGWFLNDGAYIESDKDRFEFYFTPEKDDLAKERILDWLNKKGYKVTKVQDRDDTYKAYNLPLEFVIKQKTYEKRIPKDFWEWELRPQRNFMLGLFSANGYCLSTRPTVAIKLTSKLLASDIAIWLNSKGIHTSCSYSKPKKIKHYNGIYTTKSTATLNIPHFTNKIAFENLVGFIQDYKADRLREIIEKANNTNYIPSKTKCLYIEESGKAPVWDFNEPLENVGYINGILVHNCAFVISDCPVSDVIPTMTVAGHKNITQYEAKEVEAAGLNKYDFLVVKCLNDIELAIKYINERNDKIMNSMQDNGPIKRDAGVFVHKGNSQYIWDLPEEPEVFNMLSEGKTETVFQLNTVSVTPFVMKIKPKSIEDCAVVTSLVRPGPLDFIDERTGRNMAEEYIERVNGRSKGEIEILNRLLPETHGVFVFQEQITKLTKELTGWDDEKAEDVRIAVGKKKIKMIQELRPQFVNATVDNGVDEKTARDVWGMIETFGRYGFNKSHAVAYAQIAYACAYLKYHYPLEWWAAVLSNADSKEITEVLWSHVKDILSPPDINLSQEEMVIDYENNTIRNKLSILKGLGEKAADKIIGMRPYNGIQDFVDKKPVGHSLARKLIHIGVLDSLFPAGSTLLEKMQIFENAVEVYKYKEKIMKKSDNEIVWNQSIQNFIEAAREHPKTKRCKHVIKEGKVEEDYIFISPMKDYILKKSIFPTIPMNLHDIIKNKGSNSVSIINSGQSSFLLNSNQQEVRYIKGSVYQNITNLEPQLGSNAVVNFCFSAYVIDAKEFVYRNGERKALKINVDIDGYMEEFVIWPDKDTGILKYPKGLKKNAIIFMFMNRHLGKEDYHTNIDDVIVEDF